MATNGTGFRGWKNACAQGGLHVRNGVSQPEITTLRKSLGRRLSILLVLFVCLVVVAYEVFAAWKISRISTAIRSAAAVHVEGSLPGPNGDFGVDFTNTDAASVRLMADAILGSKNVSWMNPLPWWRLGMKLNTDINLTLQFRSPSRGDTTVEIPAGDCVILNDRWGWSVNHGYDILDKMKVMPADGNK